MRALDRLLCLAALCRRAATFADGAGVGVRCPDCGRVHAWVPRAEIEAVTRLPAHAAGGVLPQPDDRP